MRKITLVGILLLLPALAGAAGFAKDPLFLSRTPVTEGQAVHVYAVITNPDTTAFTGTLVFNDANIKIGTSALTIPAGGTQTASVSWTPSAGTHTVSAQLVAKDGAMSETMSQTFAVNAKPKPVATNGSTSSPQAAAAIDSSAAIQKDITNLSPQVGSASEPVFTIIDGARNSIANTLDSQIASTKEKVNTTPKPGIVAGASTEDVQVQNPTNGFWYWLYTAYLYILLVLRWLVGNAGVFYPFIAILFLYFLFKMYRRFRRPY